MVIFEVPAVAVAATLNVTTLLAPAVDAGLNAALTPEGRPLAANEMLPVKPPVRVIVTVLVPLAPWFTVRAVGLAESEKSGVTGCVIVKAIAAV